METLQCALDRTEIRGSLFEFGAVDSRTLVHARILNCRRRWYRDQFGKSQVFLAESARCRVAQGKKT